MYPQFTVVSKPGCPNCVRAKDALLRAKAPVTEIFVENLKMADINTKLHGGAGHIKTYPLVLAFEQGREYVVGGADDLEKFLRERSI